ncbi:hypothetical protein Tco_0741309 [Tanacetum coccineum]
MSQPANDEFSQHLSDDEESNHEDASDTGAAPKQRTYKWYQSGLLLISRIQDEEEAIREIEKKNLENNVEDETLEIDEVVNIKESRNHPLENVIGNLNQRTLRSQAQNQSNFYCFISTIEPKNVNEALGDES